MNQINLTIEADDIRRDVPPAFKTAIEATKRASAAFADFGTSLAQIVNTLSTTPALLRKLEIVDAFYGQCRYHGFSSEQSAVMYTRAEAESMASPTESLERALARVLVDELVKNSIKTNLIGPIFEENKPNLIKTLAVSMGLSVDELRQMASLHDRPKSSQKPWIKPESWRTKGRRGFA